MRLTVPALRDDTIVLRPPDPRDAAAITAAVQDPEIPRFTMVPSPYSIDDAAGFIVRATAWWRSGDAAPFVIVAAETGTLLGAIGLHDIGRDTGPAHIGYWVDAAARGRGVATRALRLVARWALDELALPRVDVHVFVENERSQRVATRAGFTPEGVRSFAGHPTGRAKLVVFSMERSPGATAVPAAS
jgi:RimJ/RimL family protein N-acetyltransferase